MPVRLPLPLVPLPPLLYSVSHWLVTQGGAKRRQGKISVLLCRVSYHIRGLIMKRVETFTMWEIDEGRRLNAKQSVQMI